MSERTDLFTPPSAPLMSIKSPSSIGPLLAPPRAREHDIGADVTTKKKIRPIKGVVVDCVKETNDTWTLYIFVGDENYRDYLAGQFVSIDPHQFPELSELTAYMEHKKGRKEAIRAYSMASTPWEPYVAITI